ncbi:65-kDa microtubule-associated protein 5-like [Carica papaya]|uniref:65-kDa microtubule-associated protein 5-like n=1 Tax=Carica papaya TaxID=3649 RepID=UPI000B8CD9E5|nr:65-kDa microtubule-associated protein 5-like [Carica papaya]
MATVSPCIPHSQTTCGSLLQELQIIWDEIGESDRDRDKMLLELEQECLDIYRRKVEKTRKYKADLHQLLAEADAEIADIFSVLGEHTSFSRGKGTLKQQMSAIKPMLEDLRLKKEQTVSDIHPSMTDPANGQSKSISNDTLAKLTRVIDSLRQEKQKRLLKLQGLGRMLIDQWDLMDTPVDERNKFDHVTSLIACTVDEVSKQGCLAIDIIEQTEVEIERLNVIKASKMKELVFKRQSELEEIYRGVHMEVVSDAARENLIHLIESGNVDLSELLSSMDDQIAKAKEEAVSRKDILDKVEKWRHVTEEEKWLDEYEKDENRYSAGKGVHKNLKRAEKARIFVSKIPSIVESLITKVKAWELERGVPFLYEKAPLLHTLEEYTVLRQEREEEKRRCREQKRLQEQLAAEQEALYGSRPPISKKPLGQSANTNNTVGTPVGRRMGTPLSRHGLSTGKERRESGRVNQAIPLNYVALPKDDSVHRGN